MNLVCSISILLLSVLVLTQGCKSRRVTEEQVSTVQSSLSSCEAGSSLYRPSWATASRATVESGAHRSLNEKLRAIESAKNEIRIAYFIIKFDETTALLMEKLLERAAAGVRVRILTDGLLSQMNRDQFRMLVAKSTQTAQLDPLKKAKGIEVAYFRPMSDLVRDDLRSMGFQDLGALESAFGELDGSKLWTIFSNNTRVRKFKWKLLIGLLSPNSVSSGALLNGLDAVLSGRGWNFGDDVTRLVNLAASETEGVTFRTLEWVSLMKRLHHKLLLIDNDLALVGGRNLSNEYHWDPDYAFQRSQDAREPVIEASSIYQTFLDTDASVQSREVADAVRATFDDYWNCANQLQCRSKIHVIKESQDSGDWQTAFSKMKDLASMAKQEFDRMSGQELAIHNLSLSDSSVAVTYLENRMFPERPSMVDRFPFPEEISQFDQAWRYFIERASPGEEVLIHNAYFLPPPSLQLSMLAAMERGVRFLVVTNSRRSSNHKAVVDFGRPLLVALLEAANQIAQKKNETSPLLRIYEYNTMETLHSKVTAIDDILIVGSTNADPRSLALDSQNGVVFGRGNEAKSLARRYVEWMKSTLERSTTGQRSQIVEYTFERAQEDVLDWEKVRGAEQNYRTEQILMARLKELSRQGLGSNRDTCAGAAARGVVNAILLNL